MSNKEGDKRGFLKFIRSISGKDRVAIISHVDTDGLVSALILYHAIGKGRVKHLAFIEPNLTILAKVAKTLGRKRINKVVILDLNIPSPERVLKQRLAFLDHHPDKCTASRNKVIYKTESHTPVCLAAYELFKPRELDWFVAIGVISDYCGPYHKVFLAGICRKYKVAINSNYLSSYFGRLAKQLFCAAIHKEDNLQSLFFSLEKMKKPSDIKSLAHYSSSINRELASTKRYYKKNMQKLAQDAEFCIIKPRYNITSLFASYLADRCAATTYIIGERDNKFVKMSIRRVDCKYDLPKAISRSIVGLKEASGGGHYVAAGAIVRAKDLDKFKARLAAELNHRQ